MDSKDRDIVEAALFMSSEPLKLDELMRISGIGSLGYLRQVLEDLQKEYVNRGIEVVNANEGWSMQVRQDLLPRVSNLTPYSDLPEGCKRTLALVIYKEPLKQSEVIKTQGNKAYAYIKYLVNKGLIRTEKIGHTKVLKLTKECERYFGEEKEKLRDTIARQMAGH